MATHTVYVYIQKHGVLTREKKPARRKYNSAKLSQLKRIIVQTHLLQSWLNALWMRFDECGFNPVWSRPHYSFAIRIRITRCGRVPGYLTWLSYEYWSVWNDRALLVAVALAALHDTAKEHLEQRALEREREQKRLLLLRVKQKSSWNGFLMASRRRTLTAILSAIEIAV